MVESYTNRKITIRLLTVKEVRKKLHHQKIIETMYRKKTNRLNNKRRKMSKRRRNKGGSQPPMGAEMPKMTGKNA